MTKEQFHALLVDSKTGPRLDAMLADNAKADLMRIGPHHHPCDNCAAKVECHGDILQNYDGFPPFICREHHLDGGELAAVLCESCAALADEGEA